MAARRRSYSLREKQSAVQVALDTNNCEAARRFSVSEKLIRDWRKAQASGKWNETHRDSRAIGRGAPPKYPDLEKSPYLDKGPPQCGTVGVDYGNDSCPTFTFTPQGNVLPSTVVVSYQLVADTSSAGSLNCNYPIDPRMCRLVVPGGTYTVRATPQNSCGAPISTCSSRTEIILAGCEPVITSPSVFPGVIAGVVIGGLGVAAVVIVGVSGWCITILIMSCTCFASLGFLALLKCLCCPCCKGTARKSSSKHRHMRNESTVTLTNPPADEYADPQSSRDRKEKDRDKIQYADLGPEFYSRGTIHQKEDPVTYTAIQHV